MADVKNYVYVYNASGDNEEIKLFYNLNEAIEYARSTYDEDAVFEQSQHNENRWTYDGDYIEDPVEILKLEIEGESKKEIGIVVFYIKTKLSSENLKEFLSSYEKHLNKNGFLDRIIAKGYEPLYVPNDELTKVEFLKF